MQVLVWGAVSGGRFLLAGRLLFGPLFRGDEKENFALFIGCSRFFCTFARMKLRKECILLEMSVC